MDLGLNDKVVFITGGSGGIGSATAACFSKEKQVKVAISYNSNKDTADKVIEHLRKNGTEAMAVKMNLNDHNSVDNAIDKIVNEWGTIDVLINNAVQWAPTEYRGKGFEEIPATFWQDFIAINLAGTVRVTQKTLPFMKSAGWGRIVTVSSDLAFESIKGSGPYSALKSALIGFNANLIEEFSSYGILCNLVLPSWTLTEKAKSHFSEEFVESMKEAFPTKHVTLPEDVANMICFLASNANKQVNGEIIRITGHASLAMVNYFFRKQMGEKSGAKQ